MFKLWVLGSSPRRPTTICPRWRADGDAEPRRDQQGVARDHKKSRGREQQGRGRHHPARDSGQESTVWHVYILRCGDGSLYTGISTDPDQRLQRHNAGKGSRYVRRKGVAALVYTEPCVDKRVARKRELEIQSWNRKKKLALLESSNGRRATL